MGHSDKPDSYVEKQLGQLRARTATTLDAQRAEAVEKRHQRGYRTARENLADLCDPGSFTEYGQLAFAAQRNRREVDELRAATPADGIITGIGTINCDEFGAKAARVALIINDYTVLAGTQGYYHHQKLDRMLEVAKRECLPVVMYTEGGGGRPGDTDITTAIGALDTPTFANWAALRGQVPRIAVNNGYCFAGNAALFGCADIRIATKDSWIGMGGPAMIEGGGLGKVKSTDIGPTSTHLKTGVADVCADDEPQAARIARKLLGYFQGATAVGEVPDQAALRSVLPDDRRYSYKVREIIGTLADVGSFTELTAGAGAAVVTGCIRLAGVPLGVLANDCRVLGGAIDSAASRKAARFMRLVEDFGLPLLTIVDTPGFMVGPDSEAEGAVLHMSDMFTAAAALSVPVLSVVTRKAYGLGAQAMVGGSFKEPMLALSWPSGEFGPMGLEGAVKLGFRKELEAEPDAERRQAKFEQLTNQMYDRGRALEVAAVLEVDAVIDPVDTREHLMRALGI